MQKIAKTIFVVLFVFSFFVSVLPWLVQTTKAAPTDWTLVADARAMKAYPDLREYVWQKTPNMLPNEQYDKIGLHRLIKQGITPKGVFLSVSGSSSSGEATISNPPTDSFVKTEDSSPPIYWANRGFDVYYMDQRSHFVPPSLNASQLSFMADWGWDQWISDIREVVVKVKEISGAQKIFIATGGNEAPLNYATLYPNDLEGIIMVEPSLYGIRGSPVAVKRGNEKNTFNLTKEAATMNSFGNWSTAVGGWSLFKSAADNPEAPVANGTAQALGLPAINPITNKTWINVTELGTFLLNYAYGSNFPGALSNTYGGYGNATVDIRFLSQADRYGLPARLKLESLAMADWVNCPYVTHDFDDNWNKINVPLISFNSQLSSNMTGTFRFVNGIGTADFTAVMLPKYGQLDVVFGTYAPRDVYQTTLDWMVNHSTAGWTLTTDSRSLKAYPDLRETIWQKTSAMPPNGQYDKIGLHRLFKPGAASKGVVFLLPGTYGNGEGFVSNPPQTNWTWTENASQPIYWANRGFDVYAIDYRTHFVPMTLNASQLSFMANWGWTQWISDIKEAIDKAKVVSSTAKVFLAGHSFGGIASMNYATKYWQEDLRGIILLDGGNATKCPTTNKFNLTAALNSANAAAAWAYEFPTLSASAPSPPGLLFQFRYAFENPAAPAEYPPGKPLLPAINPLTNKTWTNITEYQAYTTNIQMSNVKGGYADINTVMQNLYVQDRYWPARLTLEMTADRDWDNCPYESFDFDDHYSEINVPLIGFVSELRNLALGGPVVKGIANFDVTSIILLKYAHNDVIRGIYSSRDVSQPVLDWMVSRYQPPAASTFSSVTVFAGQTWYFCVHSNGGVGPHIYQWYEGSTPIAGQTTMVLPASKPLAGTYTYYCKVTDAEGTTANSSPVTLTVK